MNICVTTNGMCITRILISIIFKANLCHVSRTPGPLANDWPHLKKCVEAILSRVAAHHEGYYEVCTMPCLPHFLEITSVSSKPGFQTKNTPAVAGCSCDIWLSMALQHLPSAKHALDTGCRARKAMPGRPAALPWRLPRAAAPHRCALTEHDITLVCLMRYQR